MTVSRYFNKLEHRGEQTLYDSIVCESIRVAGFDVLYIKRDADIDPILYESRNAKFDDNSSWTIEASIPDNLMGWEGEGQAMAQFGIQIENTGNILIAKTSWELLMSQRAAANKPTQDRPLEGDLLYFGYGYKTYTNTLFQINHVDFSDASWQLGRTFVYRLRCSLYKPTADDLVEIEQHGLSDQLEALLTKEQQIKQNETTERIADTIRQFDETHPFGSF